MNKSSLKSTKVLPPASPGHIYLVSHVHAAASFKRLCLSGLFSTPHCPLVVNINITALMMNLEAEGSTPGSSLTDI